MAKCNQLTPLPFKGLTQTFVLGHALDFLDFFARDVFVRRNRRAIAILFVRPSVCMSERGAHCDHTVHLSADLSLWLDCPMFFASWHQGMFTYS